MEILYMNISTRREKVKNQVLYENVSRQKNVKMTVSKFPILKEQYRLFS